MSVTSRYDLHRGTFGQRDGDTVHEDLTDIIINISPTERPFMSNVGRGDAEDVIHEWQRDELEAATANAFRDGQDYDTATEQGSAPFKLQTSLQISRKHITVTRRAELVNKAGRASELSYQVGKRGKALARDLERICLIGGSTAAASGGNPAFPPTAAEVGNEASTAPLTPCLNTWLQTNTYRATGAGTTDGANGTLNGGSNTFGLPTTAARDASTDNQEPLAEDNIHTQVANIFTQGSEPRMMLVGPQTKGRISRYMFGTSARIATPFQDHGKDPMKGLSVVGAVDYFVTDFGVLSIVPNLFMREQDVFILNPDYIDIVYLDGFRVSEISTIGDAERYMLTVDWGLAVREEASCAGIFDVSSAAMVTAATPV